MTLKRKNGKSWLIPNCKHVPACPHPAWFCFCEHNNWLTVCAHTVSTHYSSTCLYGDTRCSTSRISEAFVKEFPSLGSTIFLRMASDVVHVLRLRQGRRRREEVEPNDRSEGQRKLQWQLSERSHPSPRICTRSWGVGVLCKCRLAHLAFKNQSAELLLRWRANVLYSHICL